MENLFRKIGVDAETLYQWLSSVCNDYLYVWDMDTDVFQVSPNLAADFGLAGNRLTQYVPTMVKQIHPRDRERFQALFEELIGSGDNDFGIDYQMRTANGAYIWMNNRGKVKRNSETGRPEAIFGAMRNLEQYEHVDHVTGLLKHEFCRDKFQSMLMGRKDFRGRLLLLGIDEFNNINTLNSRTFGDMVLRAIAQDLMAILPDGVGLYRFEGDQFLLAGAYAGKTDMLRLYEEIRSYAMGTHRVDKQTYRFTVSGGLVSYPEDGCSWSDLEKGASVALKQAKENGKNQCVEFTREMLKERIGEQYLNNCMAQSIEQGFQGFRLVFQPLCDTNDLKVRGAEALLRYRMPDGKEISPEEFIPLLESSQLILSVGLWVLEQAVIACKEWMARLPEFVMNVNVSYVQLRDSGFCKRVEEILHRHDFHPQNLVLELTESHFITDDSNVNDSLNRLRNLRIRLAMDDFGTGYSSLGRLADLDVDVVKIDRFFVRALHVSQYNHDFVEAVIRLCHNLQKKVCVEGVETREEWESTCLLNADSVQGFYISRPVEKPVFYSRYVASDYNGGSLAGSIEKEKLLKQLVNDKELLFAMMNATPLCLLIWNHRYEILSCNQEAVLLLGAEGKQDLIENFPRYSPLMQPGGRTSGEMVHEKITEAFVTGRSRFQWVHLDGKGRELPVEVICVRLPYQDDYVVASYTRDLRAEIEAEERNQKFRQRLWALLDATPLCLNLWNKDFQNVMCNREAVELFQLADQEDYLAHFFQLSPERQPDGRLSNEKAVEKIAAAIETGREQFQWMHCKLNGETIPAEITLVRMDGMEDDGSVMVAGFTRDLRAQVKAEKVERALARRIRAVMDATPLSCVLWNIQLEILDCNQIAVDMFGAGNVEEVLGGFDSFLPQYQPDGSLSLEKKREKFEEVKEKGRCVFEWMYLDRNREEIPCEVTLVRVAMEDGEDIIIAYSRDLRELKRTLEINERLVRLAHYDNLTGSLSRSYFMEILSRQFEPGGGNGPIALGIFDLDGFKGINDTYGHDAGDMALRRVVRSVSRRLPPDAYLGRFGGDEFMVLLCGQSRESVSKLLQEIVEQIPLIPLEYEGHAFRISISFGMAFQNEADDCPNDLIRRSDGALYETKRNGRNGYLLV